MSESLVNNGDVVDNLKDTEDVIDTPEDTEEIAENAVSNEQLIVSLSEDVEALRNAISEETEAFRSKIRELSNESSNIEQHINENKDKHSKLFGAIEQDQVAISVINASLTEELKGTKIETAALSTEMNTFKASMKELTKQITITKDQNLAVLENSKQDGAKTKAIADRAEEKDKKVEEYQIELKDLQSQYSSSYAELWDKYDARLVEIDKRRELKFEEIEKLLPGATSAGLAKAFKDRKEDVSANRGWWIFMFICAVSGLIIFGLFTIFQAPQIKSIQEFFIYILSKSPLLAGIILLEEFARRNLNIKLRLEEEYAYKEVLSNSFQGYMKQLEAVKIENDDTKPTEASAILSKNLLDTLKDKPGRLIDKEKKVSFPTFDKIDQVMEYFKEASSRYFEKKEETRDKE